MFSMLRQIHFTVTRLFSCSFQLLKALPVMQTQIDALIATEVMCLFIYLLIGSFHLI